MRTFLSKSRIRNISASMTDKEKRLRGIEGVARIRKQIVVAQLCKVSQKWVEFVRSREHGYGRDEWGLPIYYNIRFRGDVWEECIRPKIMIWLCTGPKGRHI